MGDVIKFQRPPPRAQRDGRTLCNSGFHKWKPMAERRFDVKQGKLVTVERCERCGKTRTRLT
jgi:hypothetical protein